MYNSIMSATEWRNVEMSKELGQYLKNGRSIFYFPYFGQIFDLWKITFRSFLVARKYNKTTDILTSEYAAMDIFISIVTTFELLPKGILSLFLRPFLTSINQTEFQKQLAVYFEKYAADLETIPFYDQDYQVSRKKLQQAYAQAEQKTWTDWLSLKCVSSELWARYWISKPLHAWFHTEANLVDPTTQFIVKWPVESTDVTLEKEKLLSQLKETKATLVSDHLYIKPAEETKSSHAKAYALLSGSRYAAFIDTVKILSEKNIQIKNIASHDHVQIKCIVKTTNENTLVQQIKPICEQNQTSVL
jgi:hypothetical protein